MNRTLSSSKSIKATSLARAGLFGVAIVVNGMFFISSSVAQTAPPPNLGEDTKGAPAIEEKAIEATTPKQDAVETEQKDADTSGAFSRATVVESRRESGQVYSIELQHSKAPNQYIEETDSDGNIEYKSNDLEETPNLPKWKLGSW